MIIFLIVILVIASICIYVAKLPSKSTIFREVAMDARAEKIFPYINNAKLLNSWNPWMEHDKKAKVSFSGPESGQGARTAWESGNQLGTGSATIIQSLNNSAVTTKLEYIKPFKMVQEAEISLRPENNKTIVKWSVSGESPLICRVLLIFLNIDKKVGDTFEKGLLKLKSIVESNK